MVASRHRWAAALVLTFGVCAAFLPTAKAEIARPQAPAKAPGTAGEAAMLGPWGVDLGAIDRSAKPGDDFFLFANGAWVSRTEIPADKASYGLFDDLQDRARAQVRETIRAAPALGGRGDPDHGQIAALYHAFMDEERLEHLDASPIREDLARISAATNRADVARLMGASQAALGSSFFALSVGLDDKDPTHYAVAARQSGLSLGSRDFYLSPSFASKKARFRAYVGQMLTLADWPDPQRRADEILALETQIAAASWTIAESQQLERVYHPTTLADLELAAPGFDWGAWVDGAGIRGTRRLIVRQDTAFPKIAKVFAETDLATLKAWLAFRTVDKTAPYLSKRFAETHFNFHERDLLGTAEQRPRWERGVDLVSDSLGQLVGKEYVRRYFSPSSKETMEVLVGELKAALRARIDAVDWMTPTTKQRALEKLSTLGQKLGYPNKWRDYSALKIDPQDLVGDVKRAKTFDWAFDRNKIGKVVDRDEWDATPQTVNAYYDEKRNEIVVPAAILQPPFFDSRADMAVNFGAIGAVIGHEITHGFDSQGRKTDARGRLDDWWRPADASQFEAKARSLGAQYDAYSVSAGAHVNGAQTMSENIADLGGVLLALDAYHAWLGRNPPPVLDGFTGEQRVFLGWAQILRSKSRPDALINQVTVDPHSPDRYRAIGPLRNIDAWYRAWSVSPAETYYLPPAERVRIW